MILDFKSEETKTIFQGGVSKKLPNDMQAVALRKLRYIHAAKTLQELRSPPGN